MDYLYHLVTLVSIYALLASSLDLVAGHSGIVSMAHAAFYGVGAYASALLSIHLDVAFLPALAVGAAAAAVLSLTVSLPSLRLHEDHCIVATFAFQVVVSQIFNNWSTVTRGPLGIPGIPSPVILGWVVHSHAAFALLYGVAAAVGCGTIFRISSGPYGRVLRAIRENEDFARSLGKDIFKFKVSAFAVSAGIAGAAGSLYAHYVSFIDPSSFTMSESILVLAMVIIGGAGSRWGPIVGAVVLVSLPEALRFVGVPGYAAWNARVVVYGMAIVTLMMARPRGLIGRYGFGR